MSIPIAVPGMNSYLYLGSTASPVVYGNPIANVGDIKGPTMAKASVDVTSMSNAGPWRSKITTLIDPGQFSFPLYFDPADNTAGGHQVLLYVFTLNGQNAIRNWKIMWQDPSNTVWYFAASILKFDLEAKVAGVITATITLDLTGQPTITTLAG